MALTTRNTSDGFIVAGSVGTTVNNTTVETTLAQYTIQGGTLGDLKSIEFSLRCRLTTPLLSVPSGALRLKFGGSTLIIFSGLGLNVSLTNQPFKLWGRITNDTPSSQDVDTAVMQPAVGTPFSLSSTFVAGAWSVDTTVDQVLSWTWQFGALNLASSLVCDRLHMEVK